MKIPANVVLPIVTALVTGLSTYYGAQIAMAEDIREAKTRIKTIEKRQEEERREFKQEIHELKEYSKIIDSNTQQILQEVRVMQALQRRQR